MVVGNDYVPADALYVGHLLRAGNAAVHADDQAAFARYLLQRAYVQPVALLVARGYVYSHVPALRAQVHAQQRRAGDSVHVIVAVYAYPLVRAQRRAYALTGRRHVLHQQRVMQLRGRRMQKRLRLRARSDAALHKQPAHQRRNALYIAKRPLPAVVPLPVYQHATSNRAQGPALCSSIN